MRYINKAFYYYYLFMIKAKFFIRIYYWLNRWVDTGKFREATNPLILAVKGF